MAANTSPIFIGTPITTGANLTNATGAGTKVTICTAGSNGARILSINAVTSDTADNDVNLFIQPGGSGTVYNIGGKTVAAGSGDLVASTTPSVNLLDPSQVSGILPDGTIQLAASDVLQAATVAIVTSGKTLSIVTFSGNY
jgi:hypothetical protein